MRILIVDDEEVSLNSVKRLLKWRGIRNVDICDNGREAIERVRETDFDIVLLDLLMPEVDGLQVLESTRPYRPHTEFVILTAIDDIPTTVKAIRLGAYDYLVKPVDNDLLFLAIKRAYEHRGLLIGLSVTAGDDKREVPDAFSETITQSPQMRSLSILCPGYGRQWQSHNDHRRIGNRQGIGCQRYSPGGTNAQRSLYCR